MCPIIKNRFSFAFGDEMSSTNTITIKNIVAQATDLVMSEVDDEIMLMSVDSGKYYGMDEIGSRIWQLIRQPIAISSLCDLLAEEFEVDDLTCQRDVLTFLNELSGEGLIKINGSTD